MLLKVYRTNLITGEKEGEPVLVQTDTYSDWLAVGISSFLGTKAWVAEEVKE